MIQPIGSKLLIKPRDVDDTTSSGIVIPGTKGQKQQVAEVIAAGDGYLLNDGNVKPLTIKAGDIIIYEKFAGTNVKYLGDEYLVIDERDVLVRISEDNNA